jgi:hypothetical protein
MATSKKEPRWVSLRVPHDHAELIAKASGTAKMPLSTWIIEVAALAAAEKLGVEALPPLRPTMTPPAPELPTADIQATISQVESLLSKLKAAGSNLPAESGTRPVIRPGEYNLQRSITPAALNRAIRRSG